MADICQEREGRSTAVSSESLNGLDEPRVMEIADDHTPHAIFHDEHDGHGKENAAIHRRTPPASGRLPPKQRRGDERHDEEDTPKPCQRPRITRNIRAQNAMHLAGDMCDDRFPACSERGGENGQWRQQRRRIKSRGIDDTAQGGSMCCRNRQQRCDRHIEPGREREQKARPSDLEQGHSGCGMGRGRPYPRQYPSDRQQPDTPPRGERALGRVASVW